MRRTAVVSALLTAAILVGVWTFASTPGTSAPLQTDSGKATKEKGPLDLPVQPGDGLIALYNRRVSVDEIKDEKTTLKEAMDAFAKKYCFVWEVNIRAFDYEGLKDVEGTLVADPRPVPAMKNVRFKTALQHLLDRIPVPSGACVLLREDHFEITTWKFAHMEIWGDYSGPRLPLIHDRFEKQPLATVLREAVGESDFNLLVDPAIAEKLSTSVNARFVNVPLDTAMGFLLEMAELGCVHRDNVLFVTTKARARELTRQFAKEIPKPKPLPAGKKPADDDAPPVWGFGIVPAPAEGSGQINPLKWRKSWGRVLLAGGEPS
jgi:hypothetical protein